MRRREEEAIVLETRPAGESDLLVALLLEGGERVFVGAPNARASRRRFGACMMPGARIRARLVERREGAWPRLEEATLLASPPTPDPLERYYLGAHVIEVVSAFAREGAEDPRLFRLLAVALERLGAGDPLRPLVRYVELWTLRLAGLMPELGICSASGEALGPEGVAVSAESGAYRPDLAPPGAWRLGPEALAFVRATRSASPETLPALGERANDELDRLLCGLIESFTERPLVARAALAKTERAARSGGGAPRKGSVP